MVKASGQIEQDLGALQRRTEEMADTLEQLYEGYLKALSEASKRQMILAAYHLCTQAYPDKFVALSWDQRNQLQQSLQVLASEIYERLVAQRDRTKKMSRRPQQDNSLEFLQRLLEARASVTGEASQSRQRADEPISSDRTDQNEHDLSSNSVDDDARVEDGTMLPEAFLQRRLTEQSNAEQSNAEQSNAEQSNAEQSNAEYHSSSADEPPDTILDPDAKGFERNAFDEVDFEDDGFGDGDGLDNRVNDVDFEADSFGDDGFDDDGLGDQLDDDGFDFEMEVPAADQRLSLSEEEDLLSALEGLARRSIHSANGVTDEEEQPLVPIHLVKQQVLLEKAIRDVFSEISEEANELLQKADVMPTFPKALMAAAADSRGMGEPVNSVPNVVKMSVRVMQGEAILDPEEDDSTEERAMRKGRQSSGQSSGHALGSSERRSRRSHKNREPRFSHGDMPPTRRIIARETMSIEALPELAAISLRLSEVEFTDPTVSAWRGRLRQKLNELKQLGMRYKKTQRALETAQAEDAWRSSWTVRPEDKK